MESEIYKDESLQIVMVSDETGQMHFEHRYRGA